MSTYEVLLQWLELSHDAVLVIADFNSVRLHAYYVPGSVHLPRALWVKGKASSFREIITIIILIKSDESINVDCQYMDIGIRWYLHTDLLVLTEPSVYQRFKETADIYLFIFVL